MPLDKLLKRCKQMLLSHYGQRLGGLVLYGSSALKKAGRDSDIDLLVLLKKKPANYLRELRVLTDVLYPLQLESPQLISAKPAILSEFKEGKIQLYRNAKRDGIFV